MDNPFLDDRRVGFVDQTDPKTSTLWLFGLSGIEFELLAVNKYSGKIDSSENGRVSYPPNRQPHPPRKAIPLSKIKKIPEHIQAYCRNFLASTAYIHQPKPEKKIKLLELNKIKDNAISRLGSNLHTALRKGCDSSATSLAYNLIAMDCCSPIWMKYLNVVYEWITGDGKQWKTAKDFCLEFANMTLNFFDGLRMNEEDDRLDRLSRSDSRTMHYVWRCVFSLFDVDDWYGFLSFIYEEKA